MDTQTKLLLGRILGEVYSLRRSLTGNAGRVNDETIFGLLNGFEDKVDEVIAWMGHISSQRSNDVAEVLDPYFDDPARLANLQGYYDIEPELSRRGVDRATAIQVLRMFKLTGQYASVIDKIERASPGSPVECHNLDVDASDL